MKKLIIIIAMATAMATAATAQNDPISRGYQRQFKNAVLPVSTSATKLLGKNAITGDMETTATMVRGSGTPLYHVSAAVGTLYIRTNGVVDSTLYVKCTGTDSSGWYPLRH